jgi:uncharacterized coiled-coil protein SlyX
LSEAENPRGPYYQEAIKEFRQLLETLGTEDLAARAEQTESLTDDQIVARISGAENRIDNLEQDVSRQREQIEDLQRCMNALGRMMQKFRASKFDSARSNFLPSVDVLEDLNRANDESDIDQLWNRIRRGQRWGPAMDDKIGAVGSHPVTQVVIGAMAQAAGAAMGDHARRAGRRRYESGAHRRSDRSR